MTPSATRRDRAILLGLLAIAAALRLRGLDSQLWLDELSALNSIRRPLADILTQWPGASSHILFEALASVCRTVLGETPVAIRLPAVVFGVAGVWGVFALATELGVRERIFVTALMAVSYHHIFFSQNARGYTTLIFFFVVSSWLLLKMARASARPARLAVGYTATAALCVYANPLGVFVPAGHAICVAAAALLARRRGTAPPVPVRAFASALAASAVTVVALYAPFAASMARFAQMNVASPVEGPRVGLWLVVEVVEGLATAVGGVPMLAVAAAIGLLGAWRLARTNPFGASVLVVPLILQFAVLAVAGVGIHPRYFAIALPVALLVGASGLGAIVERAVALIPGAHARALVAATTLAGCVAVSAVPLARYYRYPKQDFLGAARYVDTQAAAGDARAAASFTASVLAGHYRLPYDRVDSLPDLVGVEATAERVWVVTSLERLIAVQDSSLINHLRARYTRVHSFPGTVGDGDVHVYLRNRQP